MPAKLGRPQLYPRQAIEAAVKGGADARMISTQFNVPRDYAYKLVWEIRRANRLAPKTLLVPSMVTPQALATTDVVGAQPSVRDQIDAAIRTETSRVKDIATRFGKSASYVSYRSCEVRKADGHISTRHPAEKTAQAIKAVRLLRSHVPDVRFNVYEAFPGGPQGGFMTKFYQDQGCNVTFSCLEDHGDWEAATYNRLLLPSTQYHIIDCDPFGRDAGLEFCEMGALKKLMPKSLFFLTLPGPSMVGRSPEQKFINDVFFQSGLTDTFTQEQVVEWFRKVCLKTRYPVCKSLNPPVTRASCELISVETFDSMWRFCFYIETDHRPRSLLTDAQLVQEV
jgi:hypothetical protein